MFPGRRAAVSCLTDEHNTIIVTCANFQYRDFVMNWVEHVCGIGITAYLVGAMDDQLLEVHVAAVTVTSTLTLETLNLTL